jgi:hypothetical protein
MPENAEQLALWWGPGILVLMGFGYGGLRLAHTWIEKSMELRRKQSEGALGVAREYIEQFLTSQRSQAEALSRLAASVEQRDTHDSFEHQEILIALKAVHHEMGRMPCRLGEPRECAGGSQ